MQLALADESNIVFIIDTCLTDVASLSLHDALPILSSKTFLGQWVNGLDEYRKSLDSYTLEFASQTCGIPVETLERVADRKSTRLNSSHTVISYAVFCLKKKIERESTFIT